LDDPGSTGSIVRLFLRVNNLLKIRALAMGVSPNDLKVKILTNYSLGRIPEESEVASVAVFLTPNEASAITGKS
jgi:hypothetical protein